MLIGNLSYGISELLSIASSDNINTLKFAKKSKSNYYGSELLAFVQKL